MMATDYNAHVELARKRLTPEQAETMRDALDDYHAAVGVSPRGWVDAQISLPAETLPQATATAVAVVTAAARTAGIAAAPVAVQVMTEAEFNRREGWAAPEQRAVLEAGGRPVDPGDLVGTTAAAALLGVTRQRIPQLVHEGRLTALRMGGRAFLFRRSQVERLAERMAKQPPKQPPKQTHEPGGPAAAVGRRRLTQAPGEAPAGGPAS